MKILVTGGTGFIGSHTTVELQQQGYDVIIVDALFNSRIEALDAIASITGKKPEFEQFDLADRAKVDDFFSRHKNIKGVIHFAAHKAVGESVEQPLKYYRNNLDSLIISSFLRLALFTASQTPKICLYPRKPRLKRLNVPTETPNRLPKR